MRWVADKQKSLLMSSGETASSSSTLHSSKKTNKITRRMQMTLCARVSVSRNSWQVVQDGSTSQKFWVFPAFHLKLRQGSWMLISSKASRANISLFIISIWRGWERASSRSWLVLLAVVKPRFCRNSRLISSRKVSQHSGAPLKLRMRCSAKPWSSNIRGSSLTNRTPTSSKLPSKNSVNTHYISWTFTAQPKSSTYFSLSNMPSTPTIFN